MFELKRATNIQEIEWTLNRGLNIAFASVLLNFLKAYTNATKNRDELWSLKRVSSSCTTSGIRPVTLFKNPVINNERGKERRIETTTNEKYPFDIDIP